jgi:fructose-1,6-bisphosphatase I
MYEAAPLAYIVEQAGGRASDGSRSILSIQPEKLHQRTPLYIGSTEFVDLAESYLGGGVQKSVKSQISTADARPLQ